MVTQCYHLIYRLCRIHNIVALFMLLKQTNILCPNTQIIWRIVLEVSMHSGFWKTNINQIIQSQIMLYTACTSWLQHLIFFQTYIRQWFIQKTGRIQLFTVLYATICMYCQMVVSEKSLIVGTLQYKMFTRLGYKMRWVDVGKTHVISLQHSSLIYIYIYPVVLICFYVLCNN